MKKLAIMQPYFFPYIGYFQLVNSVDRFVVFDDVHFIKKGWINRNNILVNGAPHLFSIPLKDASQNRQIREIALSTEHNWTHKLLRTFEMAYKKAPYFPVLFPMLENLLNRPYPSVAALNVAAIRQVCEYLEITTELVESSTIYQNNHLKAQDRILDICRQEQTEIYINPSGGINLYDPATFAQNGIRLMFIRSTALPYPQFGETFVPNLSFLDALMFLDKATLQQKLGEFELLA